MEQKDLSDKGFVGIFLKGYQSNMSRRRNDKDVSSIQNENDGKLKTTSALGIMFLLETFWEKLRRGGFIRTIGAYCQY